MPGPVSNFPLPIQAALQQNFLQRAFQEYLYPNLCYWNVAEHIRVPNHIGDTLTLTRPGLLPARPDPVDPAGATGLDNGITPRQWNLEQYTLTLQLFNDAQDIDLMTMPQMMVTRFLHSVKTNNIAAGQSVDIYARNALFGGLVPSGANIYGLKEGYLSGNTWVTAAAAAAATTVLVDDVTAFGTVVVNGVPTAVSATNPLSFFVNGVANTANIIGVTPDNATNSTKRIFTTATGSTGGRGMSGSLTLAAGGLNVAAVVGDVIVASDAAFIVRPNAKTSYKNLASSDTMGQAQILDAVAALRNQQVPTFADGTYLIICDYVSMRQLYGDQDFKIASQGLAQSSLFKDAVLDKYLGVTFMHSSNAPVQAAATGGSTVTVRRPIVCGADCLIDGEAQIVDTFGGLPSDASSAPTTGFHMSYIEADRGIAVVLRPPLDRLSRNMSIGWQSIRDFVVPTDLTATSGIILTGSNARRKRAVVIEHAG